MLWTNTSSIGFSVSNEEKSSITLTRGVYEAQFSEDYEVCWKNRKGFAEIAILAKVLIIPVFTRNIREAFRPILIHRPTMKWFYERTRFQIPLFYGGFPVKLKTYIGDPIPYDPSDTPESLRDKIRSALQDLIRVNQSRPGNILRALLERL
jgi:hypothetical protein